MLLTLTPTQLRALGPGPAALLADLLDRAAPGQPVEATCPNQGRRGYGSDLRALAEAGILQVEDPGSWTRASYTVRLCSQEDAEWFLRNGSLARWPRLYPDIWDQLREERPEMSLPDFRRRFRYSVLSALGADPIPSATAILSWMATGLNRTAPAPSPEEPDAPPAPSDETPIPRAARKAFAADPDYDRLANFQFGGGAPDGK